MLLSRPENSRRPDEGNFAGYRVREWDALVGLVRAARHLSETKQDPELDCDSEEDAFYALILMDHPHRRFVQDFEAAPLLSREVANCPTGLWEPSRTSWSGASSVGRWTTAGARVVRSLTGSRVRSTLAAGTRWSMTAGPLTHSPLHLTSQRGAPRPASAMPVPWRD